MKEIQSIFMPDQDQTYTAKSFSSECFSDCKACSKNPVPCCKTQFSRVLRACHRSFLQSKGTSPAHHLSKGQEVTEKALCFVHCLPFLLVTVFLSGTPRVFYNTSFSQLSSFYKHRDRPCSYDQLTQNTVTSSV